MARSLTQRQGEIFRRIRGGITCEPIKRIGVKCPLECQNLSIRPTLIGNYQRIAACHKPDSGASWTI